MVANRIWSSRSSLIKILKHRRVDMITNIRSLLKLNSNSWHHSSLMQLRQWLKVHPFRVNRRECQAWCTVHQRKEPQINRMIQHSLVPNLIFQEQLQIKRLERAHHHHSSQALDSSTLSSTMDSSQDISSRHRVLTDSLPMASQWWHHQPYHSNNNSK